MTTYVGVMSANLHARTRMLTTGQGDVGYGQTTLRPQHEVGITGTVSNLERMSFGRTVR